MLPGRPSGAKQSPVIPPERLYCARGFISVFLSLVNLSRYTSVANRNVRFSFLKSGFELHMKWSARDRPASDTQNQQNTAKPRGRDGVE